MFFGIVLHCDVISTVRVWRATLPIQLRALPRTRSNEHGFRFFIQSRSVS